MFVQNYIYCSAAWKFVNPLEFYIFLHKYDPKQSDFRTSPESRQREPNQMRQKYFLCHLFIQENDPILHICEWQKYVNLLD